MRVWGAVVALVLAAVVGSGNAAGAIDAPARAAAPVVGVRMALVIGNANYASLGKLQSPPGDVRVVSAALQKAGWNVTVRSDLTKAQMEQALHEFGGAAAGADYALVYFSGHGAERGTQSYLAGVDFRQTGGAPLEQLGQIQAQAVRHDAAVQAVAGARVGGFLVIDSDRTNFLPDVALDSSEQAADRGSPRHYGPVSIYYSSSRGDTAVDGVNGVSPYARAFAEALEHPSLEEAAFFRRVRERVEVETDNAQTPAVARLRGGMPRTFRFNASREPTAADIARLANTRPSAFSEQPRLALLIGNSDYNQDRDVDDDRRSVAVRRDGFAPDLPNPVNDARDLKASLEKLRFTVDIVENANYDALVAALFAFEKKVIEAGPDALVVIYYAGHAIQVGGANYMIPVGAKLPAEDPRDMLPEQAELLLSRYALPLQSSMMERLRQRSARGLNLIILDACRENPWESRAGRNVRARSVSRGLADIRTSLTRTVISYATKEGDIADDGDGRNSPYTAALLSLIEVPDQTVVQLMDAVSVKVQVDTERAQTPYYYGPGIGSTCLGLCPVEAPAPATPAQLQR